MDVLFPAFLVLAWIIAGWVYTRSAIQDQRRQQVARRLSPDSDRQRRPPR
jgi:hypothetical protein